MKFIRGNSMKFTRGDRIQNLVSGLKATIIYEDNWGTLFVVFDRTEVLGGQVRVDPLHPLEVLDCWQIL